MLLLDENKLEEMSEILKKYMELVPFRAAEGHFTLPNENIITFDDTQFWRVLFGGDQLTVARMHGTQALRDTQDTQDQLEGVIPVVEDWHARMTFLKVDTALIYFTANNTVGNSLLQQLKICSSTQR